VLVDFGQNAVEVAADEGPVKRPGNLAVVVLERADAGSERCEVSEVIRSQCFALQDREIDLYLVQRDEA
jgi:hypothetical protein